MFRLDREALGNPCDLCIHNKKSHGILGAQLTVNRHCRRCMEYAKRNGGTIIGLARNEWRESGSFKTIFYCNRFELDTDKLENVVYNKLGFSLSGGTVGLVSPKGAVDTAYDPLWVARNSFTVISRNFKLPKNTYDNLKKLLKAIHDLGYYKQDDEQKCVMVAAAWVQIDFNFRMENDKSAALEYISNKENTINAQLYWLQQFGHPTFDSKSRPDIKDRTDEVGALMDRIYDVSQSIGQIVGNSFHSFTT